MSVVRVSGYRHRGPISISGGQSFWEVAGLEWGPLSLVSTIEELHGRKRSDFGLENREYGCRDCSSDYATPFYPQNLALTSLTSCGSSIGIFLLRTEATEFVSFVVFFRNVD
jgi:hypothetical protein